ncbi:hypothetical protein JXB28_00690 [Candidatus Woesearchaeota archaeon]|nr:hypothetical protein [Candidatus Woesearchaeota archaeon]
MEIKIDTKHDSPEDIKKAIEFLRRMVGGEADNRGAGSDFSASSEAASGMSAMFGDTPIMSSIPDGNPDDDSSEEEEKEKVQIIPY